MKCNSPVCEKALRLLVFALASTSFVCLLGQFYGLWPMRLFACVVFPPATLALAWLALRSGPQRMWIISGTLGGVVAAVAYDLYRLPFVLCGTPLFTVFRKFGEMLLGTGSPRWFVELTGWTYHFSNGAALGIMFLAMAAGASPRALFWGAVAWALFVEAMLLLTPYANFLGLRITLWFVFLTVSAHMVFGATLGGWCARRGVKT